MSGVIDEYMVRLGASIDQSGMNRFAQALREAANVSDVSAKSIAGAFFKAQTEIVSGFLAIGTAALTMVDKVAMADQQYRMFAMHMFIAKDAARSLKIGMDALGASLGEIRWDPTGELQGRMNQLIADQRAMAPAGDFDAQMKKVRDLRFEFTRMDVEMQYMGMNVVQAFMKSLGMGPDTALMKLREFNKYIIDNMPAISDKIVKLFGPVWKDLKDVFGATTAAAKAAAVAFTNLVGIFDPSVQSTTFNLEKFAAALVDIVHTFATWAENIAKVEEGLAHLTSATALAARGKFGEAGKELGAAGNDVTPGSVGAGVVPGIIGSYGGWKLFKFVAKKFGFGVAKKVVAGEAAEAVTASGWESVAAGAGMTVGADVTAGSVLAAAGEGAAEGSVAGPWGAIGMGLLSVGAALGGSYVLSNLMDKVFGTKGSGNLTQSSATPDLIAAMMKQESGGNQQAISSKGAIGVMQLMPGTAAALGVDPYNREQNIAGGTELMNRLLKQYHGNLPEALGAYNWNPQGMDRFLAGKATMPSETQNYISSVLRNKGATGSVAVGPITINIAHPDAETAANTAINRLQDMQGKAVQRNLAYQADLAYDY